MRSLSWDQVRARRLQRSHLLRRAPARRLESVVGEVCGVQAQVLAAAELAVGTRVNGATQQEVRKALWERRTLVKTYGPRGTLHLLPSAELGLWMAAMRARSDLSIEGADDLTCAIGDALDGRNLTRQELAHDVAQRLGSDAGEMLSSTWGHGLARAAWTGRLCFGPSRGAQVTYVRADQWVTGWSDVDPQQALAEVFLRYARAYGPIRVADFRRWFLLPKAVARQAFESCRGRLVEVEVEGEPAWILKSDARGAWPTPARSLFLLPQYDCYVLNGEPRERVLPASARERVFGYRRGRWEGAVALQVVLVDGQVGGMWERRLRRGRLELRVECFRPPGARQRALLQEEAARLGSFLGTEATLELGRLD